MAIRTAKGNPPRARLTSQGQITVPKAVRAAMDLVPGDEIEFELRTAITVRRYRRPGILSFVGIAREAADRLPRTTAEIDALIADARSQRLSRDAR